MDSSAVPPHLVLALLFGVPGVLVTAALFRPGTLSLPGRFAMTYAAGYATVSLSAWALVCFSALSRASFLTVWAAATIAAGVLALRRAPWRAHVEALREEFRADAPATALGLVVIGAIGVAFLASSPLWGLNSSTPLRFWGDGVEIAAAGGIPTQTLQWGSSWPPATSKMLLNTHTAAVATVSPDALPTMTASMWFVAVFFAAGMWWLAWELGLRWLAPLLPLVTGANTVLLSSELARDLVPYRGESFGRVVAFCALALGVAALRDRRGWRHHLVVGLLFGVAAGTHLVPTLLCLAMLGGYWLRLLLGRGLDPQLFVRPLAAVGVAGALLGAVWATPGANLGFDSTTRPDAGMTSDVDAAQQFATGEGSSIRKAAQRTWYVPPRTLLNDLVVSSLGTKTPFPVTVLVLVVAVLLGLALAGPQQIRAAATVGATLLGTIAALTVLFDLLYHSYAQALFGPRRLFDYTTIPVWLLLAVLATVALAAAQRRWPPVTAVAPAVAAVLLGVLLLPRVTAPPPRESAIAALDALQWVRDNTPCDARIVSNHRSGGSYQVLTGRVSITEGMGPFFRPDMLAVANQILIDKNDFFRAPAQGEAFLAKHGIDYVVMALDLKADAIRHVPGSPARMGRAAFLEPVFEGERVIIYRVNGIQSDGEFPDPAEHPGYECAAGPIPV